MTITVNAPNGVVVNFPDGTDTDTIKSVMAKSSGGKGRSWDEDVLPSFGSGLRRGAEALVGIPGDVGSAMDAAAAWGANKLGIAPPKMSDIPAMSRPGAGLPTTSQIHEAVSGAGVPDYAPETTAGEYARTIGEFVPGAALAPERSIGRAVLKYGVAPGVASETAGQTTEGTPLEPYARTAAAVAGGFAPSLVERGRQAGKSFLEPFSEEGRRNIAARGFREAFTDPRQAAIDLEAAKATQQPGAGMGEIVPGSRPTTGQLTGDQGALQLERSFANENRTLYHENPYGTGADQQNAARSAALAGLQPTGAPTDVSDAIRRGLNDIEAAQDRAVQEAQGKAQAASAGLGRGMTPEAQGAALRASLQAGRDAAKANERKLWAAIDPDGTLSMPAGPVTSAAGKIANSIPRTARPMSGEEAAIFDTAQNLPSIAPFNEMTALRSRISTAMREELRSAGQSPTYARLSQLRGAVEVAINNAAAHKAVADDAAVAAGEMSPADTLGARIAGVFNEDRSAAGQNARAGTAQTGTAGPAGGPAQIGASGQGARGFGDSQGDQAVSGQVPGDSSKVYYPSGSLDVSHEVVNLPDLITSHDTNFNVNRAYPPELQPRARETAPARDQVNGMAARYATEAQKNLAAPSMFGDVVKPSDVLRTALRNEGAQAIEPAPESAALQPGLQANMDEAAAARLRAASAATRQRAQTFDQGPVGDVLRQRSGSSDYRLPDSAVPGRVWVPGARGAQTVQAYGAATGSVGPLVDAAMESLRREAMTPEGIIDPGKFASWQKRYQDAIRALPPQAQRTFSDAASASQAYEAAAVARRAAIDAHETSLAKRFLGLSTGQDVTRTVGAIFGSRNAVEQMRELAGLVAGNPEAQEGLKKAIADHITSIATGMTEAGASGVNKVNASAFQKFVARNGPVLKAAGFTEAQISNMRALANDLQRSQRTMQATALPTSPNTAADVMGAMRSAAKEAGKPSLLSKILAGSWAGLHVGGPTGALTGAAGAIGEHLTRAMRGAGLAKARDIVQAGILDPEIGRQLLRRASTLPDGESERALAKAIAKRSAFIAPGLSASTSGNSSNPTLPASVGYGLKRLSSVLSQGDAQTLQQVARARSPLGEQVRSSLDKLGKAATMLKGSPSAQNIARFMLAARNLSTNLSDAGIDVSPENIARATVGFGALGTRGAAIGVTDSGASR